MCLLNQVCSMMNCSNASLHLRFSIEGVKITSSIAYVNGFIVELGLYFDDSVVTHVFILWKIDYDH